MVQLLWLSTFTAKGISSTPGGGTNIPQAKAAWPPLPHPKYYFCQVVPVISSTKAPSLITPSSLLLWPLHSYQQQVITSLRKTALAEHIASGHWPCSTTSLVLLETQVTGSDTWSAQLPSRGNEAEASSGSGLVPAASLNPAGHQGICSSLLAQEFPPVTLCSSCWAHQTPALCYKVTACILFQGMLVTCTTTVWVLMLEEYWTESYATYPLTWARTFQLLPLCQSQIRGKGRGEKDGRGE